MTKKFYKNLGDNIVAGGGYSTDSQQVAPQACYNASASVPSGSQAYVELNTALSFSHSYKFS
jgi:hypothetical protein